MTDTQRVTDDKIIDRVLLKLAGTPMGMSLEEWGALSNDLTEVAISTREKDATIAELRAEVERLTALLAQTGKEFDAAFKCAGEYKARAEAAESALATANAREFARAALKEISADRKPVKIDLSKEWCMKMAEREGNHEIGAGSMADQTDRQRAEAKAPSTEETCWLDLVEKDDRTSPTEYPDHALITRNELFGYMQIARREGRIAGREEAAKVADAAKLKSAVRVDTLRHNGSHHGAAIAEAAGNEAAEIAAAIRALKPKES